MAEFETPRSGEPYGGYSPPPFGGPAAPGPPPPPAVYGTPPPVAPRRGLRGAMVLVAVLAALIGGAVGAVTVAVVGTTSSNSSATSFTTQAAPQPVLNGTVSAAAEKIGPSVVTINVSAAQQQDTGSGVIMRTNGYILTNNHVIAAAAGGAGTISVILADGRATSAKIVGQDPSDDLAVIKVDLTGLTAATFASSGDLVVGQPVVAVGAPLGLSDTVTSGIVSNTARPVQTGDTSSELAVFNAIQTDAAINPGNSGGPLVNLNGDVVGINAAIATDPGSGGLQVPGQSSSGNIGIGFAIPSDEAGRIAAEIIATGKATHAIIGVTVSQSTSAGQVVGATVASVTAGGPAADAGITAGDVVTDVDGQRITSPTSLIAAIRSHAPSQKVTITFQRAGASRTVTVTLGAASS